MGLTGEARAFGGNRSAFRRTRDPLTLTRAPLEHEHGLAHASRMVLGCDESWGLSGPSADRGQLHTSGSGIGGTTNVGSALELAFKVPLCAVWPPPVTPSAVVVPDVSSNFQ
jgi:hypothetical protein